jgi:hypothetical protein
MRQPSSQTISADIDLNLELLGMLKSTLYESAAAFAEIGAGVSFGPNAIRAVALLDPATMEGYKRRETTSACPKKQDSWFNFRNWDEGRGVEGYESSWERRGVSCYSSQRYRPIFRAPG